MILSGSKSYYDDFVRKKDTSRTVHDPPSLLTDRGAYMNFLEVQLERVSAACLGVQSYDDRFNDMQTLIVSLDKKCAATAKMVSISQQCTEQLRNDTDAKLDKLSQEVRAESWETRKLLEVISTRIAAVEHKAAELPGIHKRLDDDNIRTKSVIENIQQLSEETDAKIHTFDCQVKDFESNQQSILQDVEELKTADSKLQFDLTESERKYHNLINKATVEQNNHFAESEDKFSRNIHIAEMKIAGNMESLQVEVASKEAGCLAAVRLLGESLREESLKIKQKLESHMTGVGEELNTSVESQMKKVNRSLADQVDVINEEIENQRKKISSLNENNRVQFKQFDRTLVNITKDHADLYNMTNSLNNTSLMGTTGRLYDERDEQLNNHHNHTHSRTHNHPRKDLEGDDDSFSLSRASRAMSDKRHGNQEVVHTEHSHPRSHPKTEHSQSQSSKLQQSQQIPSTPSDMLMSSVHDINAVESTGLKYIGSGLYVDGHRATSPGEYSDSNRATSPLGAVRDANNNVVSEIKPSKQQTSGRFSEREMHESARRSNERQVAQSSDRSNERGVAQSSGRPNEREVAQSSGRPNEREMHQSSDRPNEREMHQSSDRSNERQVHQSSGRPNEREMHQSSGRPNERQVAQSSGRPNEREKDLLSVTTYEIEQEQEQYHVADRHSVHEKSSHTSEVRGGKQQNQQPSHESRALEAPPPPPPPPLAETAVVSSPNKRRPAPTRGKSESQSQSQSQSQSHSHGHGHSQMHQISQDSHHVLQRANTLSTTTVNSTSQPAGVVLAPVTSGFMHFLKKRQNSLPSQDSETIWKDVLTEERPPWLPSGTTTTSATSTSTTRRVESQNVSQQQQQQQQQLQTRSHVNNDNRTAASTISDIHSHAVVHDQGHITDKILPEKRHYDNSAHLTGASAHIEGYRN